MLRLVESQSHTTYSYGLPTYSQAYRHSPLAHCFRPTYLVATASLHTLLHASYSLSACIVWHTASALQPHTTYHYMRAPHSQACRHSPLAHCSQASDLHTCSHSLVAHTITFYLLTLRIAVIAVSTTFQASYLLSGFVITAR